MIAKSAMTQLLAAFLLMKADGCNAEVRIVNDPGGGIGNYVARYERLRATGDAIVIDGYCASACTIVLGIIPPIGPNAKSDDSGGMSVKGGQADSFYSR